MSKFKRMLAAASGIAERVNKEHAAAVERQHQLQANRMLALFRELLAEHATHNHRITVETRTGSATIYIDDTRWDEFAPHLMCRPFAVVLLTLRWIDAQLDHSRDYLIPNNTLLNHPKVKP